MRLAYAGLFFPRSRRDIRRVLDRLDAFDGWALSVSAYSLRLVLPLCPSFVRVGSWTYQQHGNQKIEGIPNVWEAVIVSPARDLFPGVPDALVAMSGKEGEEDGDVIPPRPIAFSAWLFGLLGMAPGDTLIDMFGGDGEVARAWEELARIPSSPRRRRRPRPSTAESGQKHTPAELPEPPADPVASPDAATLDEMN